MSETIEFTEVETLPEVQNMEVVKLNITDTAIAEMKAEYMTLTVNGIDDKAGLKRVYEGRQIVKRTRVSAEKYAKDLKDKAVKWQRKVNEEKDRVCGELEAIEAHLQSEEDKIEAEKQRIKREVEELENARIQSRIDKLAQYGRGIDYATVKAIDDTTFETVLDSARIQYEADLAAKAEAERMQKEEAARMEAERKELDELRRKQSEADAIIKAEQDRIAAQQKAEADRLKAEQDKIDAEKKAIAEKKRKEQEAAAREKELEQARIEAAEKARLKAIEDARIAADQKAEADRLEKEELERQAALRPDKEKLEAFAGSLSEMKFPVVTDAKAKAIVASARVMVEKMESYILDKIKSL